MTMETPCCPKSLYAGLPAPQISPVAAASVIPSTTLFKFKTSPFALQVRQKTHKTGFQRTLYQFAFFNMDCLP